MPPRKRVRAESVSSNGSAAADDTPTDAAPPSVSLNTPLLESYTWHSEIPEQILNPLTEMPLPEDGSEESPEQREARDEERRGKRVMLGVDEAGRGPVLGPLVYGIAYCPINFLEKLKEIGFADSKTLTAESRSTLLRTFAAHAHALGWAVRVMAPQDISAGMLKRHPYNLNAQSHDATISLIQDVMDKGIDLAEVYVDTVGPAQSYQTKLEGRFPGISFTVASKADSLFPIVSAASIAAKVTRDTIVEGWTFGESGSVGKVAKVAAAEADTAPTKKKVRDDNGEGETKADGPAESVNDELGSGYPGDPRTVAWLKNHFDNVFGYPQVARFSWATVKTILEKKGVTATWIDEPKPLSQYFSTQPANAKRPAALKELGLVSVSDL